MVCGNCEYLGYGKGKAGLSTPIRQHKKTPTIKQRHLVR